MEWGDCSVSAGPSRPDAQPHNKDLEIMHRSLRANRGESETDGGSSAELQNLHQIVSELVEEEENLLHAYEFDQENAELLTEEGRLAKVQGEDVVDYDIDMYAERLDEILSTKIRMHRTSQQSENVP